MSQLFIFARTSVSGVHKLSLIIINLNSSILKIIFEIINANYFLDQTKLTTLFDKLLLSWNEKDMKSR